MPTEACVAKAPHPPMRDCICTVVEGIDRANELAEAIANKLFGDGENDRCEKAVPPQNVQNGIDRSDVALRRRVSRLDEINTRL